MHLDCKGSQKPLNRCLGEEVLCYLEESLLIMEEKSVFGKGYCDRLKAKDLHSPLKGTFDRYSLRKMTVLDC